MTADTKMIMGVASLRRPRRKSRPTALHSSSESIESLTTERGTQREPGKFALARGLRGGMEASTLVPAQGGAQADVGGSTPCPEVLAAPRLKFLAEFPVQVRAVSRFRVGGPGRASAGQRRGSSEGTEASGGRRPEPVRASAARACYRNCYRSGRGTRQFPAQSEIGYRDTKRTTRFR